ncbi:MAG: DUF3168 domain-containing protein [Pseudomonadota bacterium]
MSALNLAAAALDLRAILHATLSAEPSVRAVLGEPVRAWDDPPSTAQGDPLHPYLTYGDMRSTDTSGDGAPQSSHQITLHVWSRYNGRAEVLNLLRLISDALEAALPHRVLPLYVDAVRAPDGLTFHGLLRLSITQTHEEGGAS